MRLPIAAFAAVLLCASAAHALPPGETKPFEPPKDSIAYAGDGCTGFYIGNGLMVTASHCVEGMSMKFTFTDGSTATGTLAIIANINAGFDDFAVYRLLNAPFIRALRVDCAVQDVGTEIHMTGYPGGRIEGFGRTSMWGRVASPPQAQGSMWPSVYTVGLSSFGGFSGSPVMRDDNNRVVGILVGSVPANRGIAFVVPMPKLCGMLGLTS